MPQAELRSRLSFLEHKADNEPFPQQFAGVGSVIEPCELRIAVGGRKKIYTKRKKN